MWIVNDFGLFKLFVAQSQASRLKPPRARPPRRSAPGTARDHAACVSRCPLSCVCVCVWHGVWGVHCVPACGVWLRGVGRVSQSAACWLLGASGSAKWAVAGDTGVRAATRRPFYAGRRRPRAPYTARAHPKATNHTAHRWR